jgi:copper chaperone
MELNIQVENLKCGGCINTVKKAVLNSQGVKDVEIDLETGMITIQSANEINEAEIVQKLAQLGYPKVGENDLGKKIKSYVSCAIGKLD